MSIYFDEKHLAKLKEVINEPSAFEEKWSANNPSSWWGKVGPHVDNSISENSLCKEEMKRENLFKMCQSSASNIECAISIMAWGGQRYNHAVTMFKKFSMVDPIINDMRSERICPVEAFSRFRALALENKIGLGVAFFTKLIFFFYARDKAYILDQWTAKSVNLLSKNKNVVLMTSNYVNLNNTEKNYSDYIDHIRKLQLDLGLCGEEVELAIFSNGKKNCGERGIGKWRSYVITHTTKK